MNLQKCQQRINELVSRFVAEIKGSAAMTRTDVNLVSESVLVPLFRAVYGYEKLRNLNQTERNQFPGIDLADDDAKTAFQVTATATSAKVEETLRIFSKENLHQRYQRLIIYILTERQRSYSGKGFRKYLQNGFAFDKNEDIRDYRHLLRTAEALPLDQAQAILSILEQHFGEGKPAAPQPVALVATESLYLDLVEIEFARTLFLADLVTARPHARTDRGRNRRFRKGSSERDDVWSALKTQGLNFSCDWHCNGGQILCFHDLGDSTLPLSRIVDQGTVSSFPPEDYYRISDDHERVFKTLLRHCLQQKLFHKGIQWQHKESLFIFTEMDGKAIREEHWEGTDSPSRKVFERTMKKNKPDEILTGRTSRRRISAGCSRRAP